MADREQLRAAMLAQLEETQFTGTPILNKAFREVAVEVLLPLIEHWTESVILMPAEEFEAMQERLDDEEPRDDLDRLAALFSGPSVFDGEDG